MDTFLFIAGLESRAFVLPIIIFLAGIKIVFNKDLVPWGPTLRLSLFLVFWLGLLLGYLWLQFEFTAIGFISGGLGYELALVLDGTTWLGYLPDPIVGLTGFCDLLLQYYQYIHRTTQTTKAEIHSGFSQR